MKKKRLGIVGTGHLGKIIAKAWQEGYLEEYELVAVAGRDTEKAKEAAEAAGCMCGGSLDELLAVKPEYIAEAASVQFLKDHALEILKKGINLVVLSIGAFADTAFYEEVKKTAKESGAKVYIASGAIGGFDVLRTIALMDQAKVSFRTKKGPDSLRNTPLFKEELLQKGEETHVFGGTAEGAISILPTKVNVAVAASLAGADPERTAMDIYSVPGMAGDDHKIVSEIDGVKATIDIYSRTAEIAAWSVVAVLRNITSPVVF